MFDPQPSAEKDYMNAMKKVFEDMSKKGNNPFGSSSEEEYDSSKFREEGNTFYRQGKYFQAISSYSRAYTLAQEGSKDGGLALANRSAVLMAVGFHKESISDSKLALANNYPEDLKYKVYQRMATCYRMLGEKELAAEHYQKCCKLIKEKLHDTQKKTALASAKNDYECGIQPKVKNVRLTYSKVPEVSYRVHPNMPGVTSALELKENSKLGFHFVTKRTLNPGDVLFVEDPLVSNLIEKKDQKAAANKEMETNYTHCFHCFKSCYNLAPCPQCYFAMFCSDECKVAAWESYHKLECMVRNKYATSRSSDDFTSNSIMVTVCCKMVSTFGVDVCIAAMTNLESAPKILQDMLRLPLALYPIEVLMKTRNLAVQLAANCFGMSGTKKKKLAEFIVIAMMVFKRNAINISQPQYHAETDTYVSNFSIGWGVFMHSGRMPHSCVPNTITIGYGGKTLVCFASEKIGPGEVIYTNYMSGSLDCNVASRREQILVGYHFTCKCEACTKGWDSYNHVNDLTLKKHQYLRPLYTDLIPVLLGSVCNNRGMQVVTDKKILQKCFKLKEALLKAEVPRTDVIFAEVERFIQSYFIFTAKKFHLDGKGEAPFLFAPDRDMAEELRRNLSNESDPSQEHHEPHHGAQDYSADWIRRQWMSEPNSLQNNRPQCGCPSCQ